MTVHEAGGQRAGDNQATGDQKTGERETGERETGEHAVGNGDSASSVPWTVRRPLISSIVVLGLVVAVWALFALGNDGLSLPGFLVGVVLMASAAGLGGLAVRRAVAMAHALGVSQARTRAALDALEAYQALMLDAVESVDEGFVLFDADGRLVAVNDRYRRAYPMVADLLVPGTAFAAILEAAARRSGSADGLGPAGLRQWLDERLTRHLENKSYAECRLGDGRWYLISERPTRAGGIVKIITDVTQHREAEAALRQAQKMDAVGQLAGGIAHEFNNMLTAIGGYARMARRTPGDAARVATCLDEVTKAADRATALTRQLLDFSRLSPEDGARPLRLGAVIGELATFLRPVLGERVRLDLDLAAPDLVVAADDHRLHQALVNLCINARDAMPAGGVITVRVEHYTPDGAFRARHPDCVAQAFAAVAVCDTGSGIEPAVMARLFEPFFTTKPLGKGTGLGLSMVYATVDGLGGAVEVESVPGAGTSFTLYLPLARAEAPDGALATEPSPSTDPEPGRSILLVEDEASVRDYLTLVLEDAGHLVFTAMDGADALMVFDEVVDGLDLVITDVALPHLDGPAIIDAMRTRRPGLPVVFMSGYGTRAGGRDLGAGSSELFLPKPVSPEALLAAVNASLAPSQPEPLP